MSRYKAFLLLVLALVFLSKNAFSISREKLEELQQAFKRGFLSQRTTGAEIYSIMKEKYREKPLLYVQALRSLWLSKKGPIIRVRYVRKIDEFGRVAIEPEVEITDIEPSKFPTAFYLQSLLFWKKDFQDLEEFQKRVDEAYRKLKLEKDQRVIRFE